MKRVIYHLGILHYLNTLSVKDQQALVNGAPKELCYFLCEIAMNCLRKNIPLTSNQIKKLKKHEKEI